MQKCLLLKTKDYCARFYNPLPARWIPPAPLAEKYYSISPYVFCAGNPVNFVDPDGMSWYFSCNNGSFITHIDDDDDLIYLITEQQQELVNTGQANYEQFKNTDADGNLFGQMLMTGNVDMDTALGVLGYFLGMANSTEENSGEKYLSEGLNITLTAGNGSQAEVIPVSRTLRVNTKDNFYYGYDVINVFSHEIKHMMDYDAKIPGANKPSPEGEIRADKFSKNHWSFIKAGEYRKMIVDAHITQEQSKIEQK